MAVLRKVLASIAAFEGASTVLGGALLFFRPEYFQFMLEGTAFDGLHVLAGVILVVIVGGVQWLALFLHARLNPRFLLGYAVAGAVMIGWISIQALVLDTFIWPHALWGGLGFVQQLIVLTLLGVFRPAKEGEEK